MNNLLLNCTNTAKYTTKPLGVILREADLISAAQVEMALKYQHEYPILRFGEILAIQGCINSRTADFFAQKWQNLIKVNYRKPLGYYLQQSGLIDKDDIKAILLEQKNIQYRFGAIAVMRGYIKNSTLDFFLKNLFPEELGESSFRSEKSLSRSKKRYNHYISMVIKHKTQNKKEYHHQN